MHASGLTLPCSGRSVELNRLNRSRKMQESAVKHLTRKVARRAENRIFIFFSFSLAITNTRYAATGLNFLFLMKLAFHVSYILCAVIFPSFAYSPAYTPTHSEVLDVLPADVGKTADVEEREMIPPGPHVNVENPEPVGAPQHLEKRTHHRVKEAPGGAPAVGATVLAPGVEATGTGAAGIAAGATGMVAGAAAGTTGMVARAAAGATGMVAGAAAGATGMAAGAAARATGMAAGATGIVAPGGAAPLTPEQEEAREEQQAVQEDVQSTPNISFKEFPSPWKVSPRFSNIQPSRNAGRARAT